MTQQDYQADLKGYYPHSTCATEYGGVRRQKHARSPVCCSANTLYCLCSDGVDTYVTVVNPISGALFRC